MADVAPFRAVLDTSALYAPRNRKALHINAALGNFVGHWSPWIIMELTRTLTWNWTVRHGNTAVQRRACSASCDRMFQILLPTFALVHPLPPYPPAWPQLTDQWDTPIWAAAKESGAAFIVSENTRDFPPCDADRRHRWEGIEYLRVEPFLRLIRGNELA